MVSIIIPCYNAARWLREAIDSCLAQTYRPVEVIVIDDGSTDDSLAIIHSYGEQIYHESWPNRGGNHARNRGFALSQGEYIQFLDADDYLLPDKIARQVKLLEETGADVVYSDWRHEYCHASGTRDLGPVVVSGAHADVLEASLGNWWTANLSLLFRREAVDQSGGWDETVQVGQDHDFLISVALTGADIRYQPGCHSIYRRYGHVTVSTSNGLRWLESHQQILEKAEQRLVADGRLTANYRRAMAKSYFHVARNFYDIDRQRYRSLMDTVLRLDPEFLPQESPVYNWACRLMGFEKAEQLASMKRRFRIIPSSHVQEAQES